MTKRENPFKVGDRVRGYKVETVDFAPQAVFYEGVVEKVVGEMVEISTKGSFTGMARFHWKQCRRLKPKRVMREFWVLINSAGVPLGVRSTPPDVSPNWLWIHVKEQREKG